MAQPSYLPHFRPWESPPTQFSQLNDFDQRSSLGDPYSINHSPEYAINPPLGVSHAFAERSMNPVVVTSGQGRNTHIRPNVIHNQTSECQRDPRNSVSENSSRFSDSGSGNSENSSTSTENIFPAFCHSNYSSPPQLELIEQTPASFDITNADSHSMWYLSHNMFYSSHDVGQLGILPPIHTNGSPSISAPETTPVSPKTESFLLPPKDEALLYMYICNICKKTFGTVDDLEEHCMTEKHIIEAIYSLRDPALPSFEILPRPHKCTTCNKAFMSNHNLKIHYTTKVHKIEVKDSGKPDPATLLIVTNSRAKPVNQNKAARLRDLSQGAAFSNRREKQSQTMLQPSHFSHSTTIDEPNTTSKLIQPNEEAGSSDFSQEIVFSNGNETQLPPKLRTGQLKPLDEPSTVRVSEIRPKEQAGLDDCSQATVFSNRSEKQAQPSHFLHSTTIDEPNTTSKLIQPNEQARPSDFSEETVSLDGNETLLTPKLQTSQLATFDEPSPARSSEILSNEQVGLGDCSQATFFSSDSKKQFQKLTTRKPVKRKRNQKAKSSAPTIDVEEFFCRPCIRSFGSSFKQHGNARLGERYLCPKCGKYFLTCVQWTPSVLVGQYKR